MILFTIYDVSVLNTLAQPAGKIGGAFTHVTQFLKRFEFGFSIMYEKKSLVYLV